MQYRLLLIASILLSTPVVLSAQQEAPDGHTERQPAIAQSDPAAVADPPAADVNKEADAATTEEADSEDSTDSMLTFMQQRMAEMISHWDKMSQTEDPAERQQLMQEHRQKMMALNAMMGNMAQQPGMMGPGRGRMSMGGMMGPGGCPMMQGKGPGMGAGMMHGKRMHGGCPMQGKGSGMGAGMMKHGKHHGMMHSRDDAGLQEAYWQLERRVDLLQQMVEYLMAE